MTLRQIRPALASRAFTVAAATVAAVVVAGAAFAIVHRGGPPTRPITAVFAEAPALYPGNHVEVLGMPVGTITAVHAGPSGVTVRMRVKRSVTIPADAQAYLVASEVVNDRYVELFPAYRSGPAMAAGTVIPESRTHIPLSVDAVLANLDSLFRSLAPTVSDPRGALASLVDDLNRELSGQGPAIHSTIASLGQASSDLATDAPGLATTLSKISPFITAAAADSRDYQTFSTNLSQVSQELNADSAALAGTLSSLQQTLAQLSGFIQANQAHLGDSLTNLDTFSAALVAKEKDLADILRVTPLALQNLDAAIYKTDPGHPRLTARVDFVNGTQAYTDQVCGNLELRFVDLLAGDVPAALNAQHTSSGSTLDLGCVFGTGAQNVGVPPGAPTIPNLSIAGLVGASLP